MGRRGSTSNRREVIRNLAKVSVERERPHRVKANGAARSCNAAAAGLRTFRGIDNLDQGAHRSRHRSNHRCVHNAGDVCGDSILVIVAQYSWEFVSVGAGYLRKSCRCPLWVKGGKAQGEHMFSA